MSEKYKRCQFVVLRFVPNLVRDESVNIGVMLYNPDDGELVPRLTDNFRRVKRLHPWADIDLLRGLQTDFEQRLAERVEDLGAYLETLEQTLSNALQLTPPRACLTENPEAELDRLYESYVQEPRLPGRVAAAIENTRAWIRQRVHGAFKRAGVLDRMQKRVGVENFTYKGDNFRLDFGYRRNGTHGFVHAIALERDVVSAKVLAYTAERVRARVPAEFTAIVEREIDDRVDSHAAIQRILDEQQISIQPLARIDDFVASLRNVM